MKPIEFPTANIVFAKDQPEYQPLPAYRDTSGEVITCWELTPDEIEHVFNTGRIWLRVFTFNQQPLQPVMLQTESPFIHTPHPQQEQSPESTGS